MNNYRIINCDCVRYLTNLDESFQMAFADPPDNIGCKYGAYKDSLNDVDYANFLYRWIYGIMISADIVWLSFNAKWMPIIGSHTYDIMRTRPELQVKPCVQTFTFGQHNHYDLGNGHRPLWRFRWPSAPLYPDATRVPSRRQENGDKRADPRGRVPSDVFDFPRVTGNSKQRRAWCPTQLNEGLVERCILLSTQPGDWVLDPFAGTGTVLRVCKRTNRKCVSLEIDAEYCAQIAEEHGLQVEILPCDRQRWLLTPDKKTVELARQAAREGRGGTIDEITSSESA